MKQTEMVKMRSQLQRAMSAGRNRPRFVHFRKKRRTRFGSIAGLI